MVHILELIGLNIFHNLPRKLVFKRGGYTLKGRQLLKLFQFPFEKGSTLKGKKLHPWGCNFFLLV